MDIFKKKFFLFEIVLQQIKREFICVLPLSVSE